MSKRAARSTRHRVRDLLLAGTAAVLATGLLVGGGAAALPAIEPVVPPLADALGDADTTLLGVARAPFCERVRNEDVVMALYGDTREIAVAPEAWGPDGERDEYGCSWGVSGDATAGASAWVGAAPVSADQARAWLATPVEGCAAADAPAFGSVSAASTCADGSVLFQGLFGDAWLTCRLTTASVDRAGRFCLAVARAADSGQDG